MQNALQVFDERKVLTKDFRIYGTPDEPMFLAKDVAEWIEYGSDKTGQMLVTIDPEEKLTATIYRSGQNREMWFLTEEGLYEVLMQSRKPIAKEFKKEVKQILKTIRKTGGYVNNDEVFVQNYLPFADEATRGLFKTQLLVIRQQNELIANQTKQLEEQQPLVAFANHVGDTTDLLDMAEFSKVAQNENIPLGRNKMFEWLKDKGYLRHNNEPYQQYIKQGIFQVKEVTKMSPYGAKVFPKTYVTGKGQIYLIEKLREEFCT